MRCITEHVIRTIHREHCDGKEREERRGRVEKKLWGEMENNENKKIIKYRYANEAISGRG